MSSSLFDNSKYEQNPWINDVRKSWLSCCLIECYWSVRKCLLIFACLKHDHHQCVIDHYNLHHKFPPRQTHSAPISLDSNPLALLVCLASSNNRYWPRPLALLLFSSSLQFSLFSIAGSVCCCRLIPISRSLSHLFVIDFAAIFLLPITEMYTDVWWEGGSWIRK